MTRYTTTYGTIRISELNRERRRRRLALLWATMTSYFSGRTLQNSATSIAGVMGLSVVTIQAYV